MAFLRSHEDREYRLLYLGGGSVHGISQAEVLVFMEELSGIPIAWQYDMISGDSVGSTPAAVLNCPKEPGSKEPRYSAKQYKNILKDVVQQTFEPYQEEYYPNMVTLEVEIHALQKAIDIVREWSQTRDRNTNNGLSNTFNYGKQMIRNWGIGKVDNEKTDLSFFNVYSGFAEKVIVPRLEKRLEKAKERVKDFFFSADIIHEYLDQYLAYDDGEPVLLQDVITGFHSEAFNIDKTKPESHTVMLPIDNWQGVITHKNMPLSEAPKRSMPAQTIFKPYYSEYSSCHYDDIAHHNTMASPMNAVRRKLERAQNSKEIKAKVQRKGMSIGTGIESPNIDPKRMGELLILGRLDSSEGAPLLKIPLIFNTSKAMRDLTEELGEDNAIFIDKIMDPKMVLNKYRYKEELRKNPEIDKKTIRQNLEQQALDMPRFNLIDARQDTIRKLEAFGHAMVWDHMDILIEEVKNGLKHAHKKGFIDEEFLEERLLYIQGVTPTPKRLEKEHKEAKSFMDYLKFGGRLPNLGLFSASDVKEAEMEPENDDNTPELM